MKCLQKCQKCIDNDIQAGRERVGFKRKWEINVYRTGVALGNGPSPLISIKDSKIHNVHGFGPKKGNIVFLFIISGFKFNFIRYPQSTYFSNNQLFLEEPGKQRACTEEI